MPCQPLTVDPTRVFCYLHHLVQARLDGSDSYYQLNLGFILKLVVFLLSQLYPKFISRGAVLDRETL